MNHKQALIELATAVLDMKKVRDLYEDSGFQNAQERYEALCDKEEAVFEKAEELLAAANQPEEHPFHAFQRRFQEWAPNYFSVESGRLGLPVTLETILQDCRLSCGDVTVQPFLRGLRCWAEASGLAYSYETRRVNGVPKRVIIIRNKLSDN